MSDTSHRRRAWKPRRRTVKSRLESARSNRAILEGGTRMGGNDGGKEEAALHNVHKISTILYTLQ